MVTSVKVASEQALPNMTPREAAHAQHELVKQACDIARDALREQVFWYIAAIIGWLVACGFAVAWWVG